MNTLHSEMKIINISKRISESTTEHDTQTIQHSQCNGRSKGGTMYHGRMTKKERIKEDINISFTCSLIYLCFLSFMYCLVYMDHTTQSILSLQSLLQVSY